MTTVDVDEVALVVDSLTNPQTFIHQLIALQQGSVLRVEIVQNFEGIVDRENLGLETQSSYLGPEYSSAIDLARRVPIHNIVNNRDDMLIDAMLFATKG